MVLLGVALVEVLGLLHWWGADAGGEGHGGQTPDSSLPPLLFSHRTSSAPVPEGQGQGTGSLLQ